MFNYLKSSSILSTRNINVCRKNTPSLRPITKSRPAQLETFINNNQIRSYAKHYKKNWKPHSNEPNYHLSKGYRPAVPAPHSLLEDKAAAIAYNEATEDKGGILSIEEVRRRAGAKKNLEKLMQEIAIENEDPLIRQAYEELEDEDRMRKGLAPLKRAPPGKLKMGKTNSAVYE